MTTATETWKLIEPFVQRRMDEILGVLEDGRRSVVIGEYPIELYDGSVITTYSFTEAGLVAANSAASSGDTITIPVGTLTLTSGITVTAGVTWLGLSRFATVISGDEISGGANSALENLSVIRTANDGSTLKGVIMAVAGTFYINGCDIELAQSGAGDARALSSEANNAILEAWNSFMNGDSTGGSGWALWRDTGTTASIYAYGGRAVGSTNPANE